MKIMFMGTPDIAVCCLKSLIEKHNVVCVVTQTDKPKGRGQKIAFPPVKELALELSIDVYQPQTLKDGAFLEVLEMYKPDVIVVVAYGKILPKYVIDYPKYGCINVHASLLPKYRGAAPIQWVIVNGERISGITTMQMDVGLDTGDMLLKGEVEITDTMTAGELHDKFCEISPKVLLDTLKSLENGEITPQKQDDSLSNYASLLTKESCKINWNDTPQNIINLIRGMNPFPTAHTRYKDKSLKIYNAKITTGNGKNGEIIGVDNGLTVACNGGAINITELQLEGKKRMQAIDFLRGHSLEIGTILGENL